MTLNFDHRTALAAGVDLIAGSKLSIVGDEITGSSTMWTANDDISVDAHGVVSGSLVVDSKEDIVISKSVTLKNVNRYCY